MMAPSGLVGSQPHGDKGQRSDGNYGERPRFYMRDGKIEHVGEEERQDDDAGSIAEIEGIASAPRGTAQCARYAGDHAS